MSDRSIVSVVLLKSAVSLLIFCLGDLFVSVWVVESGALKSPTTIMSLLICPFVAVVVSILFIYVDTPILGTWVFIILSS